MKTGPSASWQLTATVLMLAHVQEQVQPWHQLDELCEQYTLFAGTAYDVRASDDLFHHDSPFRMTALSGWESGEMHIVSNGAPYPAEGTRAMGLTPQRRVFSPSRACPAACADDDIT
jgi:hypothetical protein